MNEAELEPAGKRCNCATFGNAATCPVHTQADFDAAEIKRLCAEVEMERGYSDCDTQSAAGAFTRAFNAEAERDALSAVIDRVRAECDAAEALHRRIWDEMEDYADIGHPKGPFPGNSQVSVEAIRLAAGLAAPVGAVKASALHPDDAAINEANRICDEYGMDRNVGHIIVAAMFRHARRLIDASTAAVDEQAAKNAEAAYLFYNGTGQRDV